MNRLLTKATATVKKIGAMREEMVQNIWLAGLGAYAKSTEEIGTLQARSQSLFEELIARGRAVETSAKEKVAQATTQTSDAVEQRIHHLVQRVAGLDGDRLKAMNDKLDTLAKQVDRLLKEQAGDKPAAKAVAVPKPKAALAKPAVKKVPARPAAKGDTKPATAAATLVTAMKNAATAAKSEPVKAAHKRPASKPKAPAEKATAPAPVAATAQPVESDKAATNRVAADVKVETV